jgi:hypothetical protein
MRIIATGDNQCSVMAESGGETALSDDKEILPKRFAATIAPLKEELLPTLPATIGSADFNVAYQAA